MTIIQWIIIALFVLIGLWYIKVEHHAHKVKIAILIILGLLIYFSMVGIFSSDKVNLTSPRGIVHSAYIYFGWIGQTASNLWNIGTDTTTLVGNAIKINNSDEEKK